MMETTYHPDSNSFWRRDQDELNLRPPLPSDHDYSADAADDMISICIKKTGLC
jgi:hypothetical protein